MAAENVLGIIGCIVLADELSYVLSRDRDLYRTFIVDNEPGTVLQDKLARREVETELLGQDDLERARVQDRYSVLIWMNPAGPHGPQGELRTLVRRAAEDLSDSVGMCLCFYGLCRDSLCNIGRMGDEIGTPMMIITDLRGEEVDDCFCANIGDRKGYADAIADDRGALFVTSGYVENWHRRGGRSLDLDQTWNGDAALWRTGCTSMIRLENGLGEKDEFEERVDAFAKVLDLKVSARQCGLGVFEHSYSLAKKKLAMMRPLTLAPLRNRNAVPPRYPTSS